MLINTLAEYIEKFGTAEPQRFIATILEDETDPKKAVLDKVTVDDAKKINLYYQMQMFFANGGSTCYVMSIKDGSGFDDWKQPLATKDDITMLVLADIASNQNDKYNSISALALAQCAELKRLLILDTKYSDVKKFREEVTSEYLQYAAAYTPYLNTNLTYVFNDKSISLAGGGVALLKDEDNKALTDDDSYSLSAIKTSESSLYNQILNLVSRETIKDLPPGGAIAGIYARVDRDAGVWKAPANTSLHSVIAPSKAISSKQQESLNIDASSGKSINAIRQFPGKGTLVWGARTLDGNSNDWRYVSVRRTVSYVEQSLERALQAYVFEANNPMTWLSVSTMIETFLTDLWLQGGLVGPTAKEAFYVNLGLGSTMTPQDILEGKMKISIGLAVVRPAEFIILDVTQLLQK